MLALLGVADAQDLAVKLADDFAGRGDPFGRLREPRDEWSHQWLERVCDTGEAARAVAGEALALLLESAEAAVVREAIDAARILRLDLAERRLFDLLCGRGVAPWPPDAALLVPALDALMMSARRFRDDPTGTGAKVLARLASDAAAGRMALRLLAEAAPAAVPAALRAAVAAGRPFPDRDLDALATDWVADLGPHREAAARALAALPEERRRLFRGLVHERLDRRGAPGSAEDLAARGALDGWLGLDPSV